MALPRRLLTALLTAALLVPVSFAPATADVVSRPDLKVTDGSARLSGTHAERVKGNFTVKNAGSLPAKASRADVQARVDGKWRYVTELRILPLGAKKTAKYAFNTARPEFIGIGRHSVRVCLDVKKKIREVREGNNCRRLGTLVLELQEHEDVQYQPDDRFFHGFPGGGYYGWVPEGYDDTDATPSALFVWLHGCGGKSEFDIYSFHAPPADDYITIAPGGREGGCWRTPQTGPGDESLVIAAIQDAARHFSIDPGRVVLGGYSSGGDLSYRTAYLYSHAIDAVLAANSAPFRDTGLTEQEALDAATGRFRVAHLAHTEDGTYPIALVRSQLQVLEDNDFPVTRFERPGDHYDEQTNPDIQTDLLPLVDP